MAKKRSEMTPEELEQARELGRNWQAQRRKRIKEEEEKKKEEKKQEQEQPGTDAEPVKVEPVPVPEKQTAPEKAPEKTEKKELSGEFVYTGVPVFICTECGGQVTGGADNCPKCGVACDWRGVPAFEDSEEFIVCDNCGAVMPVAEFRGKCRRCGYAGGDL